MKTALITGMGEEGSYLIKLLLNQGYMVHRLESSHSSKNKDYASSNETRDVRFKLHIGDFQNTHQLKYMIQETQPDEIYNFATLSHVDANENEVQYPVDLDGIGTLKILELVQLLGLSTKTKIYQASTYELYGMITG